MPVAPPRSTSASPWAFRRIAAGDNRPRRGDPHAQRTDNGPAGARVDEMVVAGAYDFGVPNNFAAGHEHSAVAATVAGVLPVPTRFTMPITAGVGRRVAHRRHRGDRQNESSESIVMILARCGVTRIVPMAG